MEPDGKRTNRIKDQDEWIIADGMQEAIISKELFDAAQERLKKIYKPVESAPLLHISTGCPDF